MKVAIFLALIGLAIATPIHKNTRSLKDDLDDFLALVPVDEIKAIYHKYENDPDIVKVVAYLKSDDFAKVVDIVANVEEIKELVDWMEGKGVPVIEFLNKIADLLGLPHWGSYKYVPSHRVSTRGWRDFLDEVVATLPLDDIIALAIDKLANSADFQELYEMIANVDYQKLHDNALKHPEIVDMLNRLKAMGVDTEKVWEFIKNIFGWTYNSRRPTRSLKEDVEEFVALIPVNDIIALYHKYENDPDIVKVVAYLKSEDFAKVVDIVANVEEIQELVRWIDGKGVPIIEFLNKIADLLGLPHIGSYKYMSSHHVSTRGWRDFIDEVVAILPLDDIIALAIDKLANSPDFQELYEMIASADYQKLHDNALKHPEIVDLLNRLKAMGVDTEKVWEFIKNIFGWTYNSRRPTRSLKEDVEEFVALIPVNDIIALYHKYENDPDIVKVVAYLKSEDFAKVVDIVANVKEIQELVRWIQGKGVPIIEFLNKIADLLGLPHIGSYKYVPSHRVSTRGWRDFIDEVVAILPLDDIIALAIDKLANSPDFQELYEMIASADYQKLHDEALKHPEIVDLLNRLKAMGVDTLKIWEFIKNIFGWTYHARHSTRSLSNDVDDFLKLIPVEKIKAVYHKYENDPEMIKIVEYLKGESFAKVVDIVANVEEIQYLVNWIEAKGVPIIAFLNKIADDLGLPHWGTYKRVSLRRGNSRSFMDFHNEILALLNFEDIAALAIEKMATSTDFQELYALIASADYQKLHDNALKHPEIVDLINRLEAMGADLPKFWELIKKIFGWTRY